MEHLLIVQLQNAGLCQLSVNAFMFQLGLLYNALESDRPNGFREFMDDFDVYLKSVDMKKVSEAVSRLETDVKKASL